MVEKTKLGMVMIKERTPLPGSLQLLEGELYTKGWRQVKNLDGYELGQRISRVGWTFFYMANEIQASVVGFDKEKTLRKAVKRLLVKLKSEKFNCLEISQVAVKRFLGIPYVTVSAHPRHIQESIFLFRDEPVAVWDRSKLAAA